MAEAFQIWFPVAAAFVSASLIVWLFDWVRTLMW